MQLVEKIKCKYFPPTISYWPRSDPPVSYHCQWPHSVTLRCLHVTWLPTIFCLTTLTKLKPQDLCLIHILKCILMSFLIFSLLLLMPDHSTSNNKTVVFKLAGNSSLQLKWVYVLPSGEHILFWKKELPPDVCL